MHSTIANRTEEPAVICRRHDVARLEVFGSLARSTDFDPATSDADFLVEFHANAQLGPFDQYFALATALRDSLGRPVDLAEPDALRNPYLRVAINRSRELVYAS